MCRYVALEKGQVAVVRSLVEAGLRLDCETGTGLDHPLHVVILHEQVHLVPMLLGMGALVDVQDVQKECSPLMMAAITEDEWTVAQLIEAGADARIRSNEGRTPIYAAAEKGD